MFCLSKGLGAPVGSLLCGTRSLIQEARRVRRMFGGGMRQAGVIAAAGLVALRKGPALLPEDHENARILARAIAALPGVTLDLSLVETNIVVFRVGEEALGRRPRTGTLTESFLAILREVGVLASPMGPDLARLVTHRDAPRPRIEEAVRRIERAFARTA
jgi:threonine aldolase